ncbi:MAG: RNA methyltransferase [Clostridiales bacterium]|nr:RNA methyltransferase [Clostridiales bacterium]
MNILSSRQNTLVKHIRALDGKRYRDLKGQFFIEGLKMVQEAFLEKADISSILISTKFDMEGFMEDVDADIKNLEIFMLRDDLFSYIAKTKTPQGIGAVINKASYSYKNMLKDDGYLIGILDGVQDPGNVGTIIRTLDCAGANGLILLDGCADPYGSKTLRATMGSIFRLPTCYIDSEEDLFSHLHDLDTHIIIGHLDGENLFNWNEDHERMAFIIGSEGRGVRDKLLKYASSLVKIPILGGAESLNASVASGIIIYEIIKNRMKT